MGMRAFVTCTLCAVLVALTVPACAQSGPSIEVFEWPLAGACDPCMTVQFGRIELRLPVAAVRRVLLAGTPALHIFMHSDDVRDSTTLLVPHPPDVVAFYREAGLLEGLAVESPRDLFEAMGSPAPESANLGKLRRVHGIDSAERYRMAEKGKLAVFLIEAAYAAETHVYVLVEGEPGAYLLSGPSDAQAYEMLLSGMSLVDIP